MYYTLREGRGCGEGAVTLPVCTLGNKKLETIIGSIMARNALVYLLVYPLPSVPVDT
jgi:hypothetical protein